MIEAARACPKRVDFDASPLHDCTRTLDFMLAWKLHSRAMWQTIGIWVEALALIAIFFLDWRERKDQRKERQAQHKETAEQLSNGAGNPLVVRCAFWYLATRYEGDFFSGSPARVAEMEQGFSAFAEAAIVLKTSRLVGAESLPASTLADLEQCAALALLVGGG